jgi:hypothetical protein
VVLAVALVLMVVLLVLVARQLLVKEILEEMPELVVKHKAAVVVLVRLVLTQIPH